MALARRNNPEGCIRHSDHGPVHVAAAVQDHARARHPPVDGLDILAVGQRGHGVADGLVKSECVHARVYATRDEVALDIFERIGVIYNRAKIPSALGDCRGDLPSSRAIRLQGLCLSRPFSIATRSDLSSLRYALGDFPFMLFPSSREGLRSSLSERNSRTQVFG